MDSLSSEQLRRLSYVELKQIAKKKGVKKTNVKAEKLISSILSASAKADGAFNSFSMCDESLDNSVFDQSQGPHEVSNIRNVSLRQVSRRITEVFSGKNSPEVSFVPHEVSSTENLSSRRRSPRLLENHSTESTPEQNKSWSEDSEIELKTPILKRSSTFSVEVPVTPVEKQPRLRDAISDISASKHQTPKVRATPAVKVSFADVEKPGQGKENISEDQTYLISACPGTVTPAKSLRRSILRHGKKDLSVQNGKPSGNKVNFITPDRILLRRSSTETPLRSVKDRPKTPIAEKHSIKRKRVPSPFPEKSPKHVKTANGQSDPRSLNSLASTTKVMLDKGLQTGTPGSKSAEKKPFGSALKIRSPNFIKIHQKAFDRMENIEEYQERVHNRMVTLTRSQKKLRKEVTPNLKGTAQKSYKPVELPISSSKLASLKPSRIPQAFRGIPFIPAVKSIRKINTNFAGQARSQNLVRSASMNCVTNENEKPSRRCQRNLFTPGSENNVFWFSKDDLQEKLSSVIAPEKHSTRKFDLKASLAKKLPYKPHRGVLKPLFDSNSNADQSHLNASCLDPIKKKRQQSREILKGVRKNRRFELQMSRRGIS